MLNTSVADGWFSPAVLGGKGNAALLHVGDIIGKVSLLKCDGAIWKYKMAEPTSDLQNWNPYSNDTP